MRLPPGREDGWRAGGSQGPTLSTEGTLVKHRVLVRLAAFVAAASVSLAACGGGGGGGHVGPPTNPTPTPTPTNSQSLSIPVSSTASEPTTLGPLAAGYSGTITMPPTSVTTTLSATFTTQQPNGTPTVQSVHRRAQNIGVSGIDPLVYLAFTPSTTLSFTASPAFSLTIPASVAQSEPYLYIAFYDPTTPSAGWNTILGPGTLSGTTVSFASVSGDTQQVLAGKTYVLLLYGLSSSPQPSPSPTDNPQAFICPTDDQSANAVAVASSTRPVRRALHGRQPALGASPNVLEVTYDAATLSRNAAAVAQRESAAGVRLMRSLTFSHTGRVTRVVGVPAGQSVAAAAALLRAEPGVLSVAQSGVRRRAATVSQPYWPRDPYFDGFTAAQTGSTSTYEQLPYAETASIPGQWDMHAVGLEHAFGYSQPGNGSGITNANALGLSAVKIAIIDTGEDPTHPELSSKLVYQHCFITNAAGTSQSSSSFETDPMGHGTDVAGIAAADMNNSLGYLGDGGNVSLMGYRVFPTPNDNCTSDTTTDPQCGAEPADIASAITDAVDNGANVISMSLGGGVCGTPQNGDGGDDDEAEGQAVENAIAANVVVVAAAGNGYGPPVETPACDTGVIAAGATALDDGQLNGTGHTGGSSSSPIEYVTDYTDYGPSGTDSFGSASSWGIVAPGGDASDDNDADDLHWIANIWTSTPFDENFAGYCGPDYPGSSGATDCQVEIEGTSMATPHIAGAAALILSVNSSYQSTAKMKQLLCSTADNLNDPNQGCGRLNVYRAMATALSDPNLP